MVESENSNDWDKAKEDLKSTDHRDSIRKAFNTTKYCGYNVYKFMQNIKQYITPSFMYKILNEMPSNEVMK